MPLIAEPAAATLLGVPSRVSRDRIVAERAAEQFGVISLAQLNAAGVDARSITRRVRSGLLAPVFDTAFALRGVTLTADAIHMAAVLAGGPGAVLSHRSAAARHGLGGLVERRPEITVVPRRRLRDDRLTAHRRPAVPAGQRASLRGVDTTTPARLLIDVAALASEHVLGSMLDDALRRRLVGLPEVAALAARASRGQAGIGRLRSLLVDRAPRDHDSVFETMVSDLLIGAGLPAPRPHRMMLDGHVLTIDLAYVESRVAIECQGSRFHSQHGDVRRDLRKANLLALHGWVLISVQWADLVHDPERIVALVLRALAVQGEAWSRSTVGRRDVVRIDR